MKVEGYNLQSIRDYMKFLRDNFKLTRSMRPGRFYTYNYNFSRDYPFEELKYYDFQPFVYIFEVSGKYAIGINFHHIPVKARMMWFDRIERLSKRLDTTIRLKGLGGRPVYRLYGLNYPAVYQVLRKSKIAIRKYRLDRMVQIRAIDIRKFREVSSFFARTYFAVGIKEIIGRYQKYIPK